jgi:hypothetical protein
MRRMMVGRSRQKSVTKDDHAKTIEAGHGGVGCPNGDGAGVARPTTVPFN